MKIKIWAVLSFMQLLSLAAFSQENNKELLQMYIEDQADRRQDDIDWTIVSARDSARQVRAYEILNDEDSLTAQDYKNAAMIFQHGMDTVASKMAVKLMKKAVELDPNLNKWLLAAAIDRDLMRRGKPQIYGTQFRKLKDSPWQLYEIDTTQVTDDERAEYNVPPLAAQYERLNMMNRKTLSELLNVNKSIDEIISICIVEKEKGEAAEYNVSENGLNGFGYNLMAKKRPEDALKIFKLNTEFYPNAFNAHDSYGECLMSLGRTKEAIQAYKKSLELNPENKNAANIIKEYEGQ